MSFVDFFFFWIQDPVEVHTFHLVVMRCAGFWSRRWAIFLLLFGTRGYAQIRASNFSIWGRGSGRVRSSLGPGEITVHKTISMEAPGSDKSVV